MTETLSDLGLRINYWFLTNRQQFRKWWVILLLAMDVFILTAVITQGLLLLFRIRDASNIIASVVSSTQKLGESQLKLAPKAVVQSAATVTPHGLGRYDFSVRLENPNENWLARVTIKFQGGKNDLSPVVVVLPPKSVRYALALDVKPLMENQTPQVSITLPAVIWEKLSIQEIAKNKIDVKVENLQQSQTILVSGDGTKRLVSRVIGEIVNSSFYSLNGLRVAIILTRGTETLGVRSAIISKLGPESRADLSVEWDTVLPLADKVEAYPEIFADLISV
ncbi:hypothetical protein C4546_02215 [Candidatus Parcubacteria bacterium]|jgi:hypothetical protein|nr:MAG: hypothetical protein C4546_02215 [Candidatus Parcubacteria bacterium]